MSVAMTPTWRIWAISFAATAAVAALGRLLTTLGPWYQNLRKPAWQPPDWLFGPAWTLIFACAAVAAVLGWQDTSGVGARGRLLIAFASNAALNVGWSLLFFRLQRPDWASVEVFGLWLSIAVLIALLWPHSRTASLLLLPYLFWVSFAAVLNLAIVRLNQPFATP